MVLRPGGTRRDVISCRRNNVRNGNARIIHPCIFIHERRLRSTRYESIFYGRSRAGTLAPDNAIACLATRLLIITLSHERQDVGKYGFARNINLAVFTRALHESRGLYISEIALNSRESFVSFLACAAN